MRWVVLANNGLKDEFLAYGVIDEVRIEWINKVEEFKNYPDADVFFDLLFENDKERKNVLKQLLPKPVIVNSVIHSSKEIGYPFIRINGWLTFLKRGIIEASCLPDADKSIAEKIFSAMNRKTKWVPDVPGFISARVVAMIINEAYFALEEKVSTREEIDTAMKLGTNYPYGPFEWATKIGLRKISELLDFLYKTEKRYQPASLLQKEAKN